MDENPYRAPDGMKEPHRVEKPPPASKVPEHRYYKLRISGVALSLFGMFVEMTAALLELAGVPLDRIDPPFFNLVEALLTLTLCAIPAGLVIWVFAIILEGINRL
ncbi:MAG: hypothetical protein AB7U73_03585 [Pirellulales bacterium]